MMVLAGNILLDLVKNHKLVGMRADRLASGMKDALFFTDG